MSKLQRTSTLSLIAFAAAGVAAGLLTQFALSSTGQPPLVPPLSLPLSMLVLAGVLLWLGVVLRRALTRHGPGHVNPFHAVRLLAGAKAGQFSGALLGGFGGGLLVQVLTRTVLPPAATWQPMLLVVITGAFLVACAVVTELLCRVPPSSPSADDSDAPITPVAPDSGTAPDAV